MTTCDVCGERVSADLANEVIAFLAVLGVTLLPWQRCFLIHELGILEIRARNRAQK